MKSIAEIIVLILATLLFVGGLIACNQNEEAATTTQVEQTAPAVAEPAAPAAEATAPAVEEQAAPAGEQAAPAPAEEEAAPAAK